MLQNIKGLTILHPILFSIFPIIFVYSQSNNILPINDFAIPIALSILVTLVLLIVTRFILKNKIKSALIVSLFVFLSLNFRHFKNWVSSYDETINLTDIHFVLVYGIIVLIGTYFFVRTKRKLDNATVITNTIAIILVTMVLINIGTYNFEKSLYGEINEYFPSSDLKITDEHGSPNVYLLILDAYSNPLVLEEFFEYDNSKFVDGLVDQGFFVPKAYSNSNYLETDLSIPSILNMDYIDNLVGSEIPNKFKGDQLKQIASKNRVMKNFEFLGYKNLGIDSGWDGVRVTESVDKNFCERSNIYRIFYVLRENSIIHSLNLIMVNNESLDSELNVINVNQVSNDHPKRQKVLCNFSELSQIHNEFEEPVFVFFHVLSPHPPWVFDSNGNPPVESVSPLMEDVKKRQGAYLDEMEFIDKKVLSITKEIISNSDTEPIIIIMSDHGTRIKDNDLTEDEKNIIAFGNLMAFYLPNEIELEKFQTTPVNVFRLIFNSYFNGDYEILENKVFENSNSESEIKEWGKMVNEVLG